MKRKAILIESSDVKGQSDLPGARVDMDNWLLFLKSENGGSWKQEEIQVLHKPFTTDVKQALDANADAYCFVAFSGHGSYGAVVLNDHIDSWDVENLKPKGERGTLIIDSCRGFSAARTYNFAGTSMRKTAKMAAFANRSRDQIVAANAESRMTMELLEMNIATFRTANASTAFVNWSDALKNSSKGVVRMYSCSPGQGADEDPASGGYYTSLLLEGAESWVKALNYATIFNTMDAHAYAKTKLPAQQVPEYSPSYLTFPFAAK